MNVYQCEGLEIDGVRVSGCLADVPGMARLVRGMSHSSSGKAPIQSGQLSSVMSPVWKVSVPDRSHQRAEEEEEVNKKKKVFPSSFCVSRCFC